MLKEKKTLSTILIVLFLFVSPIFVFSHSMWINITDYYPEIHNGELTYTKLYLGWGHHFPVDDFLSKNQLQSFLLIDPDSKKKNINPDVNGGFLETVLKLNKKGSWIVSAASNPGFYTMYLDSKNEMHHKIGPKTDVKGRVIMSLYYEQFAKTIICVGDENNKSFSKPIGHKLEIIPLENPIYLKGCGGHFLPVKVLFNGKPAMFKKVYATYSGFSFDADNYAYTTSTNSQGIANIKILSNGQWLIKTEIMLPATKDMKEKCNEMHYTATLTIGVK